LSPDPADAAAARFGPAAVGGGSGALIGGGGASLAFPSVTVPDGGAPLVGFSFTSEPGAGPGEGYAGAREMRVSGTAMRGLDRQETAALLPGLPR
jgi:hypothetical protein